MNFYFDSKIYKIYSDKTDLIYIGSTTQELYRVLNNHKNKYIRQTNKLLEIDENIKIKLIKYCSCKSKKELKLEQQKYIKENEGNYLNDDKTEEEIKEQNKEKQKKWKEENKEEIKEKSKIYREKNKEKNKEKYKCICGSEILKRHKNRHEKSKKHIKFINS